MVAEENQRVDQLALFSQTERINNSCTNGTTRPRKYPKDKFIQELFEEQVEKTPNAVAVVYGERA